MDKKTIFITGAANGIGRATAEKFIKEGWYVGLFDIDETNLKKLSKELGEENCCYKKCDITNVEEMQAAVKHFTDNTKGRMDVLFANAGIIVQGKFEEGGIEAYRRLVNVNSFGVTNTVYQALPALKKTKKSQVIVTSSSSGIFGIPSFAVYSSTKAYNCSMVEALGTEFAKYNISVCSIMPLFVQTKMMDDIEDKHKAFLTPEDIAKTVFKATKKTKKVHWLVGKNLGMMGFMKRILPTRAFQKFIKAYLKE